MRIVATTEKGLNKKENEDRIVIGRNIIADGVFQTKNSIGTIAIADGVGGNKGGAIASHFVAKELSSVNHISLEKLQNVNNDLIALSLSNCEYQKMGTTLSGLYISENNTFLFSIGNTRVYLLQARKYLKQITSDDTMLNHLLETGQMTSENRDNYDKKNEITACFGGGSPHFFKISFSSVELPTVPFLMTSDGVHDYVSIDDMEEIITKHGVSLSSCQSLIEVARAAGSQDDISIILGEM